MKKRIYTVEQKRAMCESTKRYYWRNHERLRTERFNKSCLDCSVPIHRLAKRCRSCAGKVKILSRSPESLINSGTWKKGMIPWSKGKENPHVKGEKNAAWKGGVTPINHLIRKSFQAQQWRKRVFERDDYTCLECIERGGILHADHIKPFAFFPELRFDINNGRTLCVSCHRKTPTWGEGAKKLYGYAR